MKIKVWIVAAACMLLTGCWDQLPLRDIKLIDAAGMDIDEESGEVKLLNVVTILKKAGQGEGEPSSVTTELVGPSMVEAIGRGDYIDNGPFIGLNTRIFLLSERFAANDPIDQIEFLLHAPYASVNANVVVMDDSVLKLMKKPPKSLTEELSNFINTLDANGIIENVPLMQFILSKENTLEDLALPLIKASDSNIELSGALLFSEGISSNVKLDEEQLRMLNFLLGSNYGRQTIINRLGGKKIKRPLTGHTGNSYYGFTVRKEQAKMKVEIPSSGLPTAHIDVRMKIKNFGHGISLLTPEDARRMEKEIAAQLDTTAHETISLLQQGNSDLLGIGSTIRAHYPKQWSGMVWREVYPKMSITAAFQVQIVNALE
ncbi:Ger(x)C family spore germination C-terminal domain-containing protein [Paenibacillus sp. PL2-23]|uniref:Ger(x)C family spore germination C-terminal domain-containing protein n=1 Tax=Paenibacillus sp. PL2-23 TaxID=2100729 RepID=UPI0030F67623